MKQVMLITFGVLGWAWYELSGGAEFEPGETGVQLLARVDAQPVKATGPEVSRASMAASDLTSVAPVREIAARDANALQVKAAVIRTDPIPPVPAVPADPEKFAALLDASEPEDPTLAIFDDVDYRVVTGTRVNLREGPATSYAVVTQLLRGEEVEVLDESGDGWVRLRALDGDNIGWMSANFLIAAN